MPLISTRFHNGLAEVMLRVCSRTRREHGLEAVALSGGVWQNMLLLERTVKKLRGAGFVVYLHRQVPANDGGLSLGQAVIAGERIRSDGGKILSA